MNVLDKTIIFAKKNKGSILAGIGVLGVFATGFLSAKAALKADKILKYEEEKKGAPLTTGEKIGYSALSYLPAVGAAVVTSAAIIAGDRTHLKSEAALAAVAAGLTEQRNTLIDQTAKLSEKSDTYISHGVEVLPGEVLFHDQYLEDMGDRRHGYFALNMCDFKDSIIDGSLAIQTEYGVKMVFFHDKWGVDWQPDSEKYGWSAERLYEESGVCFIDIYAMPVMVEDEIDYYEVIYATEPRLDDDPDIPW